jgi:hypothetical protein
MLRDRDLSDQWVTFHVPHRKESVFRGERNGNLHILTERFHLAGVKVRRDEVFHFSVQGP